MFKYKRPNASKGIPGFLLDLCVLVLGIYMALWMENKVQTWKDADRQDDYLYRLSVDLETDQFLLENTLKNLTEKLGKIESGIGTIQSSKVMSPENADDLVMQLSMQVMNYYFFEPEDFTFMSMRESGDFKLIKSEQIKVSLLKLHRKYDYLAMLQTNYKQGLDDEFIPMWVRNVDFMSEETSAGELIDNTLFRNMLIFVFNETTIRVKTVEQVNTAIVELQGLLEEELAD
ncbi:MAG: hypothetical protein GY780_18970 [bacterium]|nr:hypothetical protein [bacterium]